MLRCLVVGLVFLVVANSIEFQKGATSSGDMVNHQSQRNRDLRIQQAYKRMQNLFDVVPPTELLRIIPADTELIHGAGPRLEKTLPSLLQSCLSLTRNNMKTIYDESKFQLEGAITPGWHDEPKWKELIDPEAYHIVIVKKTPTTDQKRRSRSNLTPRPLEHTQTDQAPSDVIGFAHFRFLPEDDDDISAVLYVMEFQMDKAVQGKGLGSALMDYLKRVSIVTNMDGIELTVQKANPKALNFYQNKCGFDIVQTEPEASELLWVNA